MPVITATVIALLALAAGLLRAARVHRKAGREQAAVQGAAVAATTAVLALACLYTLAIVAGAGAFFSAYRAVHAFERGRMFTAVAWAVALFVCLSLTGLVGR
jgi:hypothetical protein